MAGEIRTLVGLAVESFVKLQKESDKYNRLADQHKQQVRQLNDAEKQQYDAQTAAWLKAHEGE